MTTPKERVEILLEQVMDKVQTIAEGHHLLSQKMDTQFQVLSQKIDGVYQQLTFYAKKTNERIDRLEEKVAAL